MKCGESPKPLKIALCGHLWVLCSLFSVVSVWGHNSTSSSHLLWCWLLKSATTGNIQRDPSTISADQTTRDNYLPFITTLCLLFSLFSTELLNNRKSSKSRFCASNFSLSPLPFNILELNVVECRIVSLLQCTPCWLWRRRCRNFSVAFPWQRKKFFKLTHNFKQCWQHLIQFPAHHVRTLFNRQNIFHFLPPHFSHPHTAHIFALKMALWKID